MTAEQREEALREAFAARAARAEAVRAIREGRADPVAATNRRDRAWLRLPVRRYLEAIPGVGRATAARAMRELRIADGRRMGGLGPRQRERLAAWVAGRVGGGADGR